MLILTYIKSYSYPGGIVLLIFVGLFADPHGLSCIFVRDCLADPRFASPILEGLLYCS